MHASGRLTSQQRDRLYTEIAACFEIPELELALSTCSQWYEATKATEAKGVQSLHAIVKPGNKTEVAFELVNWAERHGCIAQLLCCLRCARQNSVEFVKLYCELSLDDNCYTCTAEAPEAVTQFAAGYRHELAHRYDSAVVAYRMIQDESEFRFEAAERIGGCEAMLAHEEARVAPTGGPSVSPRHVKQVEWYKRALVPAIVAVPIIVAATLFISWPGRLVRSPWTPAPWTPEATTTPTGGAGDPAVKVPATPETPLPPPPTSQVPITRNSIPVVVVLPTFIPTATPTAVPTAIPTPTPSVTLKETATLTSAAIAMTVPCVPDKGGHCVAFAYIPPQSYRYGDDEVKGRTFFAGGAGPVSDYAVIVYIEAGGAWHRRPTDGPGWTPIAADGNWRTTAILDPEYDADFSRVKAFLVRRDLGLEAPVRVVSDADFRPLQGACEDWVTWSRPSEDGNIAP